MTKERTSTKEKTDKPAPAAEAAFRADPVLCFLEPKSSAQTMWGMSLRDRLIKQFAKEDVT